MDEVSISLAGNELTIHRSKLRKWFELEEIRESLREAAESGDLTGIASLLVSYLSAASSSSNEPFESAPWYEVAEAYSKVEVMNFPRIEFPMLDYTVSTKKNKDESVPWDFGGRTWYSWVHILASNYGWSLSDISELVIEDGIALVQEALVQDQFKKEWEYSLSENAYQYEPSSKKSIFKPLPRPNWMGKKATIKVTTMRKDLLPVGVIENLSGMGLHGQIETPVL